MRKCHQLWKFMPHQHYLTSIPTENHILQRLFCPIDIKIVVKAIRESIKQIIKSATRSQLFVLLHVPLSLLASPRPQRIIFL